MIEVDHLANNQARIGLHIYDERKCGDFSGTFKIHDNVVLRQSGAAFNANAAWSNCITIPMEVYNNLFVDSGLAPWPAAPINISLSGLTSHINFHHNTIYGDAAERGGEGALYIQANGAPAWNFCGTYEWHNNIVVESGRGGEGFRASGETQHERE